MISFKKIINNIYNNILIKFYKFYYNNLYGPTILTISYLILLRITNIAYCGWFEFPGVYWDFPLEKDVAAQSWGEQSESSAEFMRKNWAFIEDWKKRNAELKKLLYTYGSRTFDTIVPNTFSQQDIIYLQTLDNLTPQQKAISILQRLYNPIFDTLIKQNVKDFEQIKWVVFTALVKDCTFTLWVQDYSETKLPNYDPNSLENLMIAINKSFILEGNGEEQKNVAAHMIIVMEKCSSANMMDYDIIKSLSDKQNYDKRYNTARYGQ